MSIIKSYTDLEQSKKLAEILPLESADMCYLPTYINDEHHFIASLSPYSMCTNMSDVSINYCTPCWSLAGLFSVLPIVNSCASMLKMKLNHKYYMELCIDYASHKYITTNDYDSPVDACVEMILKLYELNLL